MTRCGQSTGMRGYTLIEILVAVAIFSVLSLAAYSALDGLSEANRASEQHADRLAELQVMLARLSLDVHSLVGRPQFEGLPSNSGGDLVGFATRLSGVRSGWANPLNQPRADLQRFMWRFSGETLERLHWPSLYDDRASAQIDLVFDDLQMVSFRYLDRSSVWRDRWVAGEGEGLPRAIELTLDHGQFGRLRRLWVLE